MTTSIELLASSKPIVEEEQLKKGYLIQYDLGFEQLENYYYEKVKHLFTMPYVYSISGLYTDAFYHYLQHHMELGDSLEIFEIPDPEKLDNLLKAIHQTPFAIQINLAELTYQNQYGTFSLHKKRWVDELKHRALMTLDGITLIRKY